MGNACTRQTVHALLVRLFPLVVSLVVLLLLLLPVQTSLGEALSLPAAAAVAVDAWIYIFY